MTGAMEKMTMSDGAEVAVYHAQPTGVRKGGLVLVQEIFGVTDHIRDLCDEYAADGYEVLSPALFDREHPGFEAEYSGDGFARAVQLARELHPFDLSLADVQTCVDALVAELDRSSANVATAVDQQRGITQAIAHAIAEVEDGTADAAANMQTLRDRAERSRHTADQVTRTAGDVAGGVEQLRGQINRLIADVRAA